MMAKKGNRTFVHGDITYLLLGNCDEIVIFDTTDLELVKEHTWCKSVGGYVQTTRKNKTVYLHQLLNATDADKVTDHINQNKLDNRKANLRSITIAQNLRNAYRRNATGERYIEKIGRKYHVNIYSDGRRVRHGSSLTMQEAILKRNELLKLTSIEPPYCGLSSVPKSNNQDAA